MKYYLTFILLSLSFNTYALGGFGSLSESEQKSLESIVKQLGISDKNNTVKEKIYNSIDFAFNSKWNSYWLGLKDLSASKYDNGLEKGYMDISFNTADNGTLYFTFVYKPEANQIIVSSKQVRHTTRKTALDVYEERKSDTNKYEIKHETDNYALLQEKGKVSYEYFHIGSNSASLVYSSQLLINL